MLACYLTWHLRQASAPLTFADEHRPPAPTPSPRPAAHHRPPPRPPQTGPGEQPIRGFRDLIDHLATLTRDTIVVGGQPVGKLADPTPPQRHAFDLIAPPYPTHPQVDTSHHCKVTKSQVSRMKAAKPT